MIVRSDGSSSGSGGRSVVNIGGGLVVCRGCARGHIIIVDRNGSSATASAFTTWLVGRTRRELIFDPFKLLFFSTILQKALKQRSERILVRRCSKSAQVLVLFQAFCSKASAKLVAPALSDRAEEGLDGLRCRFRRLFIVTSQLLAITCLCN